MKKFLIFVGLLLLRSIYISAVPAYPAKKVVTLSNGMTIALTLRGDEHFSYYTDDNNQPYCLQESGEYIPISSNDIAIAWNKKIQEANTRRQERARARGIHAIGEPQQNLTGKKKGIVILMEFQDQKFSIQNPKATYQDFFNKEGYNDYGMTGSVKDYFKAQSYGDLEIDFDVAGPYEAFHTMSWYGAHDGNSNDRNPAELMKEACLRADEDVNFAEYDWNGDGEVEQIFVIYAGYGENYGAPQETIWPHEWAFSGSGSTLNLDNVILNTYACSCELRGTTGAELDGIGPACHEFSHCLGLPDFYDTKGTNYAMGKWDVMCSGSYNNNGCTPAGYTSYEKTFAGWIKPIELNTMTRIEGMKPISDSKEAYILYNDNNKNEYYLLENRQNIGFDAGLSGHGLLVLHVDYDKDVWASNSVNVAASRQRMTIIPADGKLSSANEKGDPFPGSQGITELTNYSSTTATLYNDNSDGTKLMGKPIDNIRESEDGLISFVACRPELGIPNPDNGKAIEGDASFIISWPAVKDAISYELEVTEMGAAAQTPAEALEREFTFNEMESKSVGFSDVSGKLSDYKLTGWSGSKIFTTPNKMRLGTSTSSGYVRTATWSVPQSAEFTIVMGANVVTAGSAVKGSVRVAFGNNGESASYDSQDFEITGDSKVVFHFAVRKDLFWIEIRPTSQMYLNYLAIYDGVWSAEQLGIGASTARQQIPRKATTVSTYTTDTNSYTLTNLNTTSRFYYRVRALGEENTYSQWSEEKSFSFGGASGISSNPVIVNRHHTIYDLQGRNQGKDINSLNKGIYIIGGKKVVR